MKIAQINFTTQGSTGNIMFHIAEIARSKGHVVQTYTSILYTKDKSKENPDIKNHYYWGNKRENFIHYYVSAVFGVNGMLSYNGTRKLVKQLEEFDPDIIHLHNIHQFCINLPILFNYIKKNKIRVVWTLHDCWSFTGHCPHFVEAKCDKWKTGCHHCPQPRAYFKMYVDNSKMMYNLKKKLFCGLEDMTIVTPSEWLANLVKQSYLGEYPIEVINNGIDLKIFKPTYAEFREKWNIPKEKHIILGVSFGWSRKKGLDVFQKLAQRLDEEKYQIVLVGTDEAVDEQLPPNVISIHCTNNQRELVEIYSEADLLVNPTREDTYPTVNMEAIACGTPVLTFETGGSPEILDKTCGIVVGCNDVDSLQIEILRICENHLFTTENCITSSKRFDMNDRFEEYVSLYEKNNN